MPLLPARRRRPAAALLQAPGPLPAVDLGLEAERRPRPLRLALAVLGGHRRPLRLPARHRRDRRPEVLLMVSTSSTDDGSHGGPAPDDRQPMSYDEPDGVHGIERHPTTSSSIGAGGAGLRAAIAAHEAGASTADRLQVPARQGPHRDGRGRHRRGDGQPLARGQLGGALPRHHARREDAQQLADGPAARPGGARAGAGARGLGRAVRPHRGRADQPARLRRPPLRPARPRRRPHRPGDDPHPPAARRAARHRRVHGVHGHRAAEGRRRRISGAFGYWRETGRFVTFEAPGRHPRHRRDRQVVQGDVQLLGVHRRRPRARAARRRQRSSTWSSSSSTRPAWCGRRR